MAEMFVPTKNALKMFGWTNDVVWGAVALPARSPPADHILFRTTPADKEYPAHTTNASRDSQLKASADALVWMISSHVEAPPEVVEQVNTSTFLTVYVNARPQIRNAPLWLLDSKLTVEERKARLPAGVVTVDTEPWDDTAKLIAPKLSEAAYGGLGLPLPIFVARNDDTVPRLAVRARFDAPVKIWVAFTAVFREDIRT